MCGIIGGVSKKIAPLTEKERNNTSKRGHPGTAIAPLLSRNNKISNEELKEKNDRRHENRRIIADAKKK